MNSICREMEKMETALQEELNKRLLEAARNSADINQIRKLLQEGADPNAKQWYNGTALHAAAADGNTEIVKLLLDAGADVNAKDKSGQTILHWSVQDENLSVIELLIKRGADIDAVSKYNDTPLHYAARNSFSQAGAVLLLLEAGADVNALNTEGQTALYNAAKKGNIFCMQVLLDHGCDPEIRDIHGKTADDILEERSVELFRKYKNIQRIKGEDRRKSITTGYEFDI